MPDNNDNNNTPNNLQQVLMTNNNNNNEKPTNLSVEPARMQRFNDSKFTSNKDLPKDIKVILEKQSMEASNFTIPKDIKNTNNETISTLATPPNGDSD